jgi:hypothetical protein
LQQLITPAGAIGAFQGKFFPQFAGVRGESFALPALFIGMGQKIASPRRALRVAAIAVAFGAAVGLSYVHGAPPVLPGAALSWSLLFHIERAIGLLAALGVVFVVGWRAIDGEFPVRFGNVEYAVESTAAETDLALARLEKRVDNLETAAGWNSNPTTAHEPAPKRGLQ